MVHSSAGQERFKICALELWATIDDDDLREAATASDAVPKNHHAGPVTRSIERQIERETTPRKGVGEYRHPWSAEWTACVGADDFNVQFGMVDVADLEGAVSMAWCSRLQLEIERCVGIGGAPTLPL